MKIAVAYARKDKSEWLELDVNEGTTVREALESSGILKDFPEIDLDKNRTGIFGRLVKLDQVLSDGDRVEIYRALIADPKKKKLVRKKT